MELYSIRCNDVFIGDKTRCIISGECALKRCGLTSAIGGVTQAWTLYTGINGIHNNVAMWYFNPFAKNEFDTTPSPAHPNILEPTEERALVEYIMFKDYFDEGILIEGLQNYMYRHKDDVSALYITADKIHLPHSYVDYWLEEARNDYEV